jgi:hypothetical protein
MACEIIQYWGVVDDDGEPTDDVDETFESRNELIEYYGNQFAEQCEFEGLCDGEELEIVIALINILGDDLEIASREPHIFIYEKEKSDFDEHNTYWNLI